VFCAPFQFGNLWEVSLDRPGFAQKLPVGHDVTDLALSRIGGRLAYVEGVTNVNIWRVDLGQSPPQARKLVMSSRSQQSPSISPDGSSIAFESNRSGSDEIWMCDADGTNSIQLTHFGTRMTGTPRWSPDGKWIAFDSRVNGEANIFLIDPKGGPPKKLETDVYNNTMPSWSKDGHWIYFVSGDLVHGPSVWKVSSGGGHAVRVAQVPSRVPMESPDGNYIYFSRGVKLWRVGTDGSGEQEVAGMPPLNVLGDETFPFGTGIYFMSHTSSNTYIDFFDVSSKSVRRILKLEKPTAFWIGAMPVSSDGKWMLYPQLDESSSNLMMIDHWL
jgi:Tol biopolymer transport system component